MDDLCDDWMKQAWIIVDESRGKSWPAIAANFARALRTAIEAERASRSAELAAIQMNGYEWMRAHNKLLGFIQSRPEWLKELIANDPREKLPSPADLPDAIRTAVEVELRELEREARMADWMEQARALRAAVKAEREACLEILIHAMPQGTAQERRIRRIALDAIRARKP